MPKSALILAASGSIVALVSCLPLLFLINLKWGSADMYESAEADFKATLATVWERSMWMKISLCLSIAATFGALVLSYKFLMYQIG